MDTVGIEFIVGDGAKVRVIIRNGEMHITALDGVLVVRPETANKIRIGVED